MNFPAKSIFDHFVVLQIHAKIFLKLIFLGPETCNCKGPVTLGYGLTRSHAEGAKAPHRESAAVSVGKRL